jgi:hypothetical protein
MRALILLLIVVAAAWGMFELVGRLARGEAGLPRVARLSRSRDAQ